MKRLILLFVFLSFIGLQTYAQSEVTGKVTGSDGLAVPGVTVSVKGTTVATVTAADGTYSIALPESPATLVYSYIGFVTQEIEVTAGAVQNVQLENDTEELDVVVVTALGIKRPKREVTYQTQKVSDEELTIVSPTRASAGMVGKVAGLQINIQDNGVNPSSQILLRGLRSISGDNGALIVIDGSIATQGAFDDLNPNDIASMNVLKGATAAALYGSRAGNGAIIVTTKKGQKGDKIKVGLNSSYTIEEVAYMPDFQDQYGTGWDGVYSNIENTNWGPRFDGTMRQIGPTFADGSYQEVPYAPVKDNLKDFYQKGTTLINTVYLSGGNESSAFYVSANNQQTDGIVLDDTYERNTFRVNASKKIGNVELSVNSSYLSDETDVVGSDIGPQDRSLYWFVLNTSANIPLSEYSDWQDPNSYGHPNNYYNGFYENPYWAIGTTRNVDYSQRVVGNINVSYDILDWINFTGRMGINNTWGKGKNYRAAQTYDPTLQPYHDPTTSFVEDSEFQSSINTMDALLTVDRKFQSFTVKSILGATRYESDYRRSLVKAVNLSIPGFYDVSNGTGQLSGSVNESQKRTYGFFGDFTFGYNNYVFLNVSGRNDWTSTLSSENNSYFYPSVGLSFVPTDAIDALKNNNILSYAKIMLSNSTVYNDLDPYEINELFIQANSENESYDSENMAFPYGDVNGFFLSSTAVDANISKEKINTTEIGVDLSFFKHRINLNASYFITKTTDLITTVSPSVASGANGFLTNIGQLSGSGIELALTGAIVNTKKFRWDLNINYTASETVVDEITEDTKEVALVNYGSYGIFAIEGEAFPQVKASYYKRDDQGRIVVDPLTGYPEMDEGLQAFGKTTPDYILGVNSTMSYRGFSLSATVDYRTGHVYYEQGSDVMEFTGRSKASVSANREDFIIPNSVIEVSEGVYEENTNIPVSEGTMKYWQDQYNNVKENYVKDATALKLRELSFGYELPSSVIDKMPLQKVKVGIIGRNLLTFLPEENRFADPEFNNSFTNGNGIGIGGYLQSPPTRSYGVNLIIEF